MLVKDLKVGMSLILPGIKGNVTITDISMLDTELYPQQYLICFKEFAEPMEFNENEDLFTIEQADIVKVERENLKQIKQLLTRLTDLASSYRTYYENKDYRACIQILEETPFSLLRVLVEKIGSRYTTDTNELRLIDPTITTSEIIRILVSNFRSFPALLRNENIKELIKDKQLKEYLDSEYSHSFDYLLIKQELKVIDSLDTLTGILESIAYILDARNLKQEQLQQVIEFLLINQHYNDSRTIRDLQESLISRLLDQQHFTFDIKRVLLAIKGETNE
jgi:hypothetical protein